MIATAVEASVQNFITSCTNTSICFLVSEELSQISLNKSCKDLPYYLKDLEQSIDDFEKTGGKREFFNSVGVNTPELEKETWQMGEEQFEKTISEARDFIKENKLKVEEAQKQLQGAK